MAMLLFRSKSLVIIANQIMITWSVIMSFVTYYYDVIQQIVEDILEVIDEVQIWPTDVTRDDSSE